MMFKIFRKTTPEKEEVIHQSTEMFREAAQSLSETVHALREDFTTHNDFVRRIRAVYDLLNDPVMLIERTGVILSVNQAFADMIGANKHDVEGSDVCTVFRTEKTCGDFITEMRTIPAGKVREFTALRETGVEFVCEVSVTDVTRGQNSILFVVARDVTKRREHEEHLLQQKMFFEAVLNQLPISVFIKTLDGEYLFLNHEMREDLERFEPRLTDEGIWSGEDLENIRNEDALLKMSSSPLRHETVLKGRHRYVGKTMVDLASTRYITGFSLDIDDDVKRKKTLQEHEERMAAMYNHSPYGMVLMGRDGEIILCNRSFASMVKKRKSELTGLSFSSFLLDGKEEWEGEMAELLSADQDRCVRDIVLTSRSGPVPVRAYVMECDGSLDGAWFSITIEDRRALVKKDRMLDGLINSLNHSSDGVMITDTEGKIVFVNDTMLSRYGYERDEVIGQTPQMWKSGRQTPDMYEHLWDTIASGQQWSGEIVNLTKDGREIREMTIITPIPSGSDVSHYMVMKKSI